MQHKIFTITAKLVLSGVIMLFIDVRYKTYIPYKIIALILYVVISLQSNINICTKANTHNSEPFFNFTALDYCNEAHHMTDSVRKIWVKHCTPKVKRLNTKTFKISTIFTVSIYIVHPQFPVHINLNTLLNT